MSISQMLVQGLYMYDAPLMQLPGITNENQPKIYKEKNVYGINQLLRLPAEKQREALNVLGDKQFEEAIQYAKVIPKVEIARALLTVIGDQVITPLSIVTLIAKIKVTNARTRAVSRFQGADIEEIADEDTAAIENFVSRMSKNESKETAPEVYCPYFAGRKESQWWVSFANFQSGKLVVPPIRVANLATERVVSVQFQAPPQPGTYTFQLLVKSDSYYGCDVLQEIRMEVADRATLPAEAPVEDDISEPEDDSIAAQMAQLRGQQAGGRRNDDDSSDEE
ncbi:secretory subunit [Linderina pennispora]|nr:secretory subunit [Linderina pennispora]